MDMPVVPLRKVRPPSDALSANGPRAGSRRGSADIEKARGHHTWDTGFDSLSGLLAEAYFERKPLKIFLRLASGEQYSQHLGRGLNRPLPQGLGREAAQRVR